MTNDALDVLDPESRRKMKAIFSGDLVNVGIINIGHAAREQSLYARTLYIGFDPHGPTIESIPRPQKTPQERLAG